MIFHSDPRHAWRGFSASIRHCLRHRRSGCTGQLISTPTLNPITLLKLLCAAMADDVGRALLLLLYAPLSVYLYIPNEAVAWVRKRHVITHDGRRTPRSMCQLTDGWRCENTGIWTWQTQRVLHVSLSQDTCNDELETVRIAEPPQNRQHARKTPNAVNDRNERTNEVYM